MLVLLTMTQSPSPMALSHEGGHFTIESRRENGQSVRLYGDIDHVSGVLTGRDIQVGHPGETCVVSFEASPFSPLRNVGGFNEEKWAKGAGLSFKGKIIDIKKCSPTSGLQGRMLRWKERQLQRIESVHRDEVALYMEALLFGESRMLDEETSFSYRVTGLLHLLVISGSHIAMLVFALRWLFKPLPIHRETKTLIVMLVITLFGWVTGFTPPVARAVFVADMILISSLCGVSIRDPIRLLSWCAAIMLVVQPYLFFNLGFQLTVTMTLFLLLTRSIWTGLFGLAIYAQWFGLIILWSVQPVLSLLAPLYNMIVAILISWIMIPGVLITFIFPFFEALLHPVIKGLNGTFQMHHMYQPWVALHEISFWNAIYLLIGLWIGLILLERKNNLGWIWAIAILISLQGWVEWREEPRVTFLDVGQGDAIVVEQGSVTGVIDVGGVFHNPEENKRSIYDPGADVVAPYIWKRGETKLDFLLLTHADHDHIGGLEGVLDSIEVDEVWLAEEAADFEKRKELLLKLEPYDVKVRLLKAGDRPYPWMWVITPEGRAEDENANSVSLFLKVGNLSYLLTGDLPETRESSIPAVDVDVFKLGHHGAESSSGLDLINRIDPEWVVVSVGANNRYGHPHPDTLTRVKGRKILRTDEFGMIVCEGNGCAGIVEREVSP